MRFLHVFLLTQPLETKLISETSGVWQPDQVAKVFVKDAVVGSSDCLPVGGKERVL